MIASLDQFKPPTLCHRSAEDAVNYAHHFTEDSSRRFAALSLDAVDRYTQGDVCLVVRAHAEGCPGECEFVFNRVPIGIFNTHSACEATFGPIVGKFVNITVPDDSRGFRKLGNREYRSPNIEGDQGAMFLGVTELIQGPEGVVPSLVWLKRAKKREDFRWQVLAAATTDYGLKSGGVVPEGELGSLRIGLSSRDGACVTTLVEDGAEIVGGVENDAGKVGWQPPCKLDLVKVLSGWQVLLNNVGPWLCVNEFVDSGVKIIDVMLCAQDSQARTIKGIAHDCRDTRSDERS